ASVSDRIDRRSLERSADIGHIRRRQGANALHFEPDGGFETREGKVRLSPAEHRPRKIEARRIAPRCQFLDMRPARIGKANHLADLVKSFACSIVHGRTE